MSYEIEPVPQSISARWFGRTITTPDESGNGHDGTLRGATLPQFISAPFGTEHEASLLLDGVPSGTASCGVDCGAIGTGVSAAFSLEFHFRRDRLGATEFIASRWATSGPQRNYIVYFDAADDKLHGAVVDGAGGFPALASGAVVAVGSHFAELSYDGATLRLFLDGTLESSVVVADLQPPDSATSLWLGRDAEGTYPFRGVIGNVRLSNIARHPATYVPDGEPFEADANTLGLWPLKRGFGPLSIDTPPHARDANNEQTTALLAGAIFEGVYTRVSDIDHFEILYAATTPFVAQKIWSNDGVTALGGDYGTSTIAQAVVSGYNVAYDVNEGRNIAPYYKLKITNGVSNQGAFPSFLSLAWLIKTPYTGSYVLLNAALNNLSRALLVRSPNTDALLTPSAITALSVNSATTGNVIIRTPAAGKAVRLWWYQMTALPTNGAAVVASLRFGAAGTLFASTPLSQYGSGVSHSFKAGQSYVQGAVDEVLYGNLSADQTVYFNVDIEEI